MQFSHFVAFDNLLILRMDLTPRKREQIVALSKHAKKSVREIGKELGIHKSTVGRVVKRSNDSDNLTVQRQGRCGRKRKTTARDDQMIMRNSIKDPRKTSVYLKRDLSAAGVSVHSSTIRRRLIERGRISRRPKKKQLLTTVMKKKRLQWAKNIKNGINKNWDRLYSLTKVILKFKDIGLNMYEGVRENPPKWSYWPSAKTPPKKDVLGLFYF